MAPRAPTRSRTRARVDRRRRIARAERRDARKGLATSGDQPADEWKQVFAPLAEKVATVNEQLRRDSRTLVIIAGVHAPVALRLREVANDGDALVHLARQRAEAESTTPEIQQALDALLQKYGHDHSRFVEAANEAVRWGEADSLLARDPQLRPVGDN